MLILKRCVITEGLVVLCWIVYRAPFEKESTLQYLKIKKKGVFGGKKTLVVGDITMKCGVRIPPSTLFIKKLQWFCPNGDRIKTMILISAS